MPSQRLHYKTLDFKQFRYSPYSSALATDSAPLHYACETTVFLNGKYSNTTYISKS